MPRLAYVNGRMLPASRAAISIDDRAFLFSDGVYEVASIFGGHLFDWSLHLERLSRSLGTLAIPAPMSDAALTVSARRLIAANRVSDGMLYLQVTRGAARREHAFPVGAKAGLVMTVRPFDYRARPVQQRSGVAAISAGDERWARRDVKSVSLLPNVLAKQAAKGAGAYEAILIDRDGTVTEGASTTVWMVGADGAATTRPLSNAVLPGSKRRRLLELFGQSGLPVREATVTLDDLRAAKEIFLTSTSSPVMPVVTLDGAPVGEARPGPVALRACDLMWAEIERQTGWRA